MPAEPVNTFEDRLLTQLVAQLPPPRPVVTRRWWTAGAVIAAVAALVAALTVTQPAYAVEQGADGSFRVTMNSTDAADIAEAEADLKARGIRIELVASTHDCLNVLGGPVMESPPHELHGPPSRHHLPEVFAFQPQRESRFVFRPEFIPAGEVLWVAIADSGTTLATASDFETIGAPQPDFCL